MNIAIPQDPEWIISEAYRIGRDIEAHAADRVTHPNNWDAVCEYVSARLAQLVTTLRACTKLET